MPGEPGTRAASERPQGSAGRARPPEGVKGLGSGPSSLERIERMKIFVAGFQHETNTFAPSPADWAAFNAGSAFPAFTRGPAMLDALGGTSLPMRGFIREASRRGRTLGPSAWARAGASARSAPDAVDR